MHEVSGSGTKLSRLAFACSHFMHFVRPSSGILKDCFISLANLRFFPLFRVVKNSDTNKMKLDNVVKIFGPVLLSKVRQQTQSVPCNIPFIRLLESCDWNPFRNNSWFHIHQETITSLNTGYSISNATGNCSNVPTLLFLLFVMYKRGSANSMPL